MISQDTIEQVKSKADITEVVGWDVSLKKDGVNTVGLCPFHNEKSPSFKVSKTKNIFKCFGCGVSGSSIDFVMKYHKLNFQDAITRLAEKYNIPLEMEMPAEKKVYTKPVFVESTLTEETINFFLSRGIDKGVLSEFKITQVNEWMPKAKAVVPTICFNYFRDNELINIKYRAKDKDFKLSKDSELIFYNLDSIKGNKAVIVVEGEIDCLTIRQAGIKSVISVPNGASNGNMRLDYLNNCFESFKGVEQIILMVDNDAAGTLLRDELARRFGYDKCLKVVYPDGCKDANDILLKHGVNKVREVIENAVEFPIEGVFSMPEMYEDVRNFYYNGYPLGAKAGIPNFDEHLCFMLGQFTILTGIPGSGKSEFTDYLMTELAKNHKWSFGICSFENQPSSLHVTKLMEKYTGKSFAHRYNDDDRISPIEFEQSVNFVDENFYFININQIKVTIDGILEKTKELILRKGIKGLLIDPWNYIEHKSEKGQTETQYISECLTKIKAFCLTHNVHIFLVAHPAKMAKVSGKYEVPTLYNVSGSAHFFNKADNGICVHRDFGSTKVDVYIQKVRYSWLGKVGFVSFNFNLDRRQYMPIGEVVANRNEPPPPPDNPRAGFQDMRLPFKDKDEDAPF